MISLSLAVLLSAAATQDRPVEAFHAVDLSGGLHATLHKGKSPGLKLTGEPSDLANIVSSVKNGKLVLERKSGAVTHEGKVTADITTPSLDALEASGGVVVSGDLLAGSTCTLSVSGGVQLDFSGVACDSLDLDASGGAGVKLAGTSKKLDLDASGGVQLETRAMTVSDAKINASGGVSGALAVADALAAELSGGVNLKVKGHPKVSKTETSGAAKLSFE